MKQKVQILAEATKGISSVLGEDDFSYFEIPRQTRISATFPTVVTEAFCSDCIICETMCPVLKLDHKRKVMTLNETACKGCGNCIPACPTSALQQRNASYGEIEHDMMKITSSQENKTPISCNYCYIRNGEIQGIENTEKSSIRLLCSGRVEPAFILNSIHLGVDGILVFGCRFADYKFENNIPAAEKRIKMAEELLSVLGWDKKRMEVAWISLHDKGFSDVLKQFSAKLGEGRS
jgi:coenzyme F420-reducing hydrogenase delta subunit/NAD-dependent dihydropyrimidine dehydrogenase PreA subunit